MDVEVVGHDGDRLGLVGSDVDGLRPVESTNRPPISVTLAPPTIREQIQSSTNGESGAVWSSAQTVRERIERLAIEPHAVVRHPAAVTMAPLRSMFVVHLDQPERAHRIGLSRPTVKRNGSANEYPNLTPRATATSTQDAKAK